MSFLAQIIGLACLLFWGFWLCCKLRLPAGTDEDLDRLCCQMKLTIRGAE